MLKTGPAPDASNNLTGALSNGSTLTSSGGKPDSDAVDALEAAGELPGYESEELIVPWGPQLGHTNPEHEVLEYGLLAFEMADSADGGREDLYSDDEVFPTDANGTGISEPNAGIESESVPSQSASKRTSEVRPIFGEDALSVQDAIHLDSSDPDIQIPSSISRYLKEYQKSGVQFLYKQYREGHGGILGDDMG